MLAPETFFCDLVLGLPFLGRSCVSLVYEWIEKAIHSSSMSSICLNSLIPAVHWVSSDPRLTGLVCLVETSIKYNTLVSSLITI